MTTHRERLERKAERRRDWADSREAKADAASKTAHDIGAGIPMGQPILVGHHSEKRARRDVERINTAMGAVVDNSHMADTHREKATNIERALRQSIYDDDPDAIEQLTAKIERLEAKRARIKAYNASCRKAAKTGGVGDTSLLDDQQRQELATTARVCAYQLGTGGAMPAYELTNLGGNINRLRKRLEALQQPERGRRLVARYEGECRLCGGAVDVGDPILYFKRAHEVEHADGCPCAQCDVPFAEHPDGDGVTACPGDFGNTSQEDTP